MQPYNYRRSFMQATLQDHDDASFSDLSSFISLYATMSIGQYTRAKDQLIIRGAPGNILVEKRDDDKGLKRHRYYIRFKSGTDYIVNDILFEQRADNQTYIAVAVGRYCSNWRRDVIVAAPMPHFIDSLNKYGDLIDGVPFSSEPDILSDRIGIEKAYNDETRAYPLVITTMRMKHMAPRIGREMAGMARVVKTSSDDLYRFLAARTATYLDQDKKESIIALIPPYRLADDPEIILYGDEITPKIEYSHLLQRGELSAYIVNRCADYANDKKSYDLFLPMRDYLKENDLLNDDRPK